jgi:AraC-like DNA-binding protein
MGLMGLGRAHPRPLFSPFSPFNLFNRVSELRNVDPYPKAYLYRRIVQAKLFIDERYAEPIDVDNICGEAAFSKFHFIRLFKKVYGRTPHTYLAGVRIERAKELLDQGMPVTDACYAVGFESPASFSRLFKRQTGSSPSAYRAGRARLAQAIAQHPLGFVPGCFAEAKGWS